MQDDLGAPLESRSQRRAAARAGRHEAGLPWGRIGLLLLVVVLGAVATRLVLFDDRDGGRPVAETGIDQIRNANPLANQVAAPRTGEPVSISADPQHYPGAPAIVTVDGVSSGPMPVDPAAGIPPELVEETEFGPIPRVGASGLTPFSAYAHPAGAVPGRPSVAVVVVGLGINEAGSLDAIERLPDRVSLAFAPYGRALEGVVAAAREGGHEVFLEIPLEPFDYPQNDPGPQTLLTGEPARANLDKLFWLLARFPGYVGVINNMGARFTASGADFAPVMEELGLRGLGYLDDGSSNRSLARQLAGGNAVPFSRADLMVDANPDRAAIEDALAALETRARQSGSAIGIVTALPVSIQAVAEWAATLEARGIALVPASGLMR